MKEIGGYFGLEQLVSNEYYKDLIGLNNGRNALLYILKVKNIKKLYIPYYLCDSVSDMLKLYNYDYSYYNIDAEFMPIFNDSLTDNEYLYVVNYYGQLTTDKIINLKQKYKQIIVDNSQAFFQKAIANVDTIYSCRKFFGVPDGAYLSTDAKIKEELMIDISNKRMSHILGRYEGNAFDYYGDFKNNDESLNSEPLKYMSKLTQNILGAIDYERVCKIRNENYAYLKSKLSIHNKIRLITPDGAFAYPMYMENGIKVRKALIQNKIYIPVLWPNVLVNTPKNSLAYNYAANILPLPCDQRYIVTDIKHIVDSLKKYF